jgi:xanthine/CO dehydrogenase XdhC/CoxF family maturation factor
VIEEVLRMTARLRVSVRGKAPPAGWRLEGRGHRRCEVLELYREIARRRDRGEQVVLATVMGAKGSTPRAVGAKMLVAMDGTIVGTVGGGYVEHEVRRLAPDVLRGGRARAVRVELTADIASNEGAICGGVMEIFLERIG